MGFFVYIIQSEVDCSYYKGFFTNPLERIHQHNRGKSKFTSRKLPWKIVYVEELLTKREAVIREKAVKKYSHAQIEELIGSIKNILGRFSAG
jgi:putative endonuclease